MKQTVILYHQISRTQRSEIIYIAKFLILSTSRIKRISRISCLIPLSISGTLQRSLAGALRACILRHTHKNRDLYPNLWNKYYIYKLLYENKRAIHHQDFLPGLPFLLCLCVCVSLSLSRELFWLSHALSVSRNVVCTCLSLSVSREGSRVRACARSLSRSCFFLSWILRSSWFCTHTYTNMNAS